jgi:uncharacterized protein (TIGR02246 family)
MEALLTSDTAAQHVRVALDALEIAWKDSDGDAFAAACTADVDFVNILGMHVRGRAEVSALHDKIFKGPYAGSTVRFSIDRIRIVSEDWVLAIVPGNVDIPDGPARGRVTTVATVLLKREGAQWSIASFHNTRRESTVADLSTRLLDAHA